jgi:hypothetical protein
VEIVTVPVLGEKVAVSLEAASEAAMVDIEAARKQVEENLEIIAPAGVEKVIEPKAAPAAAEPAARGAASTAAPQPRPPGAADVGGSGEPTQAAPSSPLPQEERLGQPTLLPAEHPQPPGAS